MTLRILVDAYLVDKPRGLGTYVRELIRSLDQLDLAAKGYEVVLALPQGSHQPPLLKGTSLRVVHHSGAGGQPFWEQFTLPRIVRAVRPDVLHCPHNTAPLKLAAMPCASVVTIHDTMFLKPVREVAGSAYQVAGTLYRRLAVGISSRRGDLLITPSRKAARDVLEAFGRESTTIYTTPSAFLATAMDAPDFIGAGDRFFLHIGGLSPHKNTARVVRVFEQSGLSTDHRLVILGTPQLPTGAVPAPWQLIPGPLPLSQVRWLYAHAQGVLFPSLDEGFGLPVIEALVSGVPLLTSDRDPMRELAADAAILVEPEDETAMIAGLRALTEPVRQSLLRQKALERAELLCASSMADQTLDVYKRAASLPGRSSR